MDKTITVEVIDINATDCPIRVSQACKEKTLWVESDAWKAASVVLDRYKSTNQTVIEASYAYPILVACLNGKIPNK